MKKWLSLSLALCLAFSFACPTLAESDKYDVTEPIAIEFWHALSNNELLNQLIDKFEEENPLITVTPIYQGDWTDINVKLSAAISAGTQSALPAVITLNPSYIGTFVEDGMVEVLNDYVAGDDAFTIDEFGKGMMDTFTWDGKYAALPYLNSAVVIYYNKDMAEAEGIELPKMWTDMEAFVEKATTASHKAIGFHAGGVWFFEPFFTNRMVIFGTELEPECKLDDPMCVEVATAIQRWVKEGKAQYYYGSSAAADGRAAFANGETFCYVQSSATYATLRKAVDNAGKFEMAMAFPVGGERGTYSLVGGQGISLVAGASQAQKNAGWKLIKYLTTEESNLALAEVTGYLPTRVTSLTSEAGKAYLEKYPIFVPILEQLDYIEVQPRYYGSINCNDIWRAEMSKAIIEGEDMEKAMKSLTVKIREYIEENN